jgi:hypothetical protein
MTISVRAAGAHEAPCLVTVIKAAFSVERLCIDGNRTTFDEIVNLRDTGVATVLGRP